MSSSDVVQVINAIAALIACIFAGIAAIHAAKAKSQSKLNGTAISEIHTLANSIKDQLVKASGDAGFVAGVASVSDKKQ